MPKAMIKKRTAQARLKENGRKCDSCGVLIKRFSKNCKYDPHTHKAYCKNPECHKITKEIYQIHQTDLGFYQIRKATGDNKWFVRATTTSEEHAKEKLKLFN